METKYYNGVAQFLLFVFLNESIDRAGVRKKSSSKRLWIENPFKGIMVMEIKQMDDGRDGRCLYIFRI